jgi:hypothetical protein
MKHPDASHLLVPQSWGLLLGMQNFLKQRGFRILCVCDGPI